MSTLFGFLLYVGIAILALFLMREFRFAMRSIRALRWRRAKGQLLEETSQAGGAAADASAQGLGYSFAVDGTDYRSDSIGFGFPAKIEGLLARGSVDAILQNAPSLTVYYDPRQPANSALVAGFQTFHGLRIAGCGCALVSLYALSFAF